VLFVLNENFATFYLNTRKMKNCLLLLSISLFCIYSAQSQTITTLAGTGTAGYSGDGSSAAVAGINRPIGCYMDAAGSLYISYQTANKMFSATS
jgi:hypothetical protein